MRPGPAPKPTALKILAGNPGRRPLNGHEPEPERFIEVPEPPAHLSDRAKLEWSRVAPELVRLGLLTLVDIGALAAYCQAYAHWSEAEEFMQANGTTMVMRNDKGEVKWVQPVPQMGIALKMLREMRAFAAEFGLTPASRSRVAVAAPLSKLDKCLEDDAKRFFGEA